MADDRLQENRRLHRAAPEQFRPFPVARHRRIDCGRGRVPLWMQGKTIQAVGVPRARRELDRIGGRNAFAARHRGDDVQHRERIRQDDFARGGPVRHGLHVRGETRLGRGGFVDLRRQRLGERLQPEIRLLASAPERQMIDRVARRIGEFADGGFDRRRGTDGPRLQHMLPILERSVVRGEDRPHVLHRERSLRRLHGERERLALRPLRTREETDRLTEAPRVVRVLEGALRSVVVRTLIRLREVELPFAVPEAFALRVLHEVVRGDHVRSRKRVKLIDRVQVRHHRDRIIGTAHRHIVPAMHHLHEPGLIPVGDRVNARRRRIAILLDHLAEDPYAIARTRRALADGTAEVEPDAALGQQRGVVHPFGGVAARIAHHDHALLVEEGIGIEIPGLELHFAPIARKRVRRLRDARAAVLCRGQHRPGRPVAGGEHAMMDGERRPVVLVVAHDDVAGGGDLLARDERHAGGGAECEADGESCRDQRLCVHSVGIHLVKKSRYSAAEAREPCSSGWCAPCASGQ